MLVQRLTLRPSSRGRPRSMQMPPQRLKRQSRGRQVLSSHQTPHQPSSPLRRCPRSRQPRMQRRPLSKRLEHLSASGARGTRSTSRQVLAMKQQPGSRLLQRNQHHRKQVQRRKRPLSMQLEHLSASGARRISSASRQVQQRIKQEQLQRTKQRLWRHQLQRNKQGQLQ